MSDLSVNRKPAFVFLITILICLLPYIILSFLSCMALDDFDIYNSYQMVGFLRVQQDVYLRWEGRYSATFIAGLFVKAGLLKYYFLHSLLLFFFTWRAILFLLTTL
ncbi:MAG TPA: hypothetical protein VK518_00875, partial [Puia sp.]|nr:hypothetical protein [Puia sp.]